MHAAVHTCRTCLSGFPGCVRTHAHVCISHQGPGPHPRHGVSVSPALRVAMEATEYLVCPKPRRKRMSCGDCASSMYLSPCRIHVDPQRVAHEGHGPCRLHVYTGLGPEHPGSPSAHCKAAPGCSRWGAMQNAGTRSEQGLGPNPHGW